MHVSFEHCGHVEQLPLGGPRARSGPLRCQHCGNCPASILVDGARQWIDAQVARKRSLAHTGQLATRRQSLRQADEEIDHDGLSAELAACALLCPASFGAWRAAAEVTRGNRGCDLLRHWTGLDKPVEVKHTRYQDSRRGFLLVRPPRQTPGRMRESHIDDAYYVLLVGAPYQHTLAGWIDRQGLVEDGQLNPVPLQQGQRECWGIHWSRLHSIDALIERMCVGGRLAAIGRWLRDHS